MSILDASTVIVLRERDHLETFMLRRHGKSSFMANAWVYPGGRLDDADTRPEVVDRIVGLSTERAREELGIDSATRAAGLYLAAIRETFEEAGILLARRRGESDWIDLVAADTETFERYREQLHTYEIALSEVAEAEDLEFPLDELAFFAHWITPTFEPKRFDTYFFVARAPARQEPLHDAKETTDSFWIRPVDALQRADDGEMYLAPPTRRTLERLARFDTVDAVFEAVDDWLPPCILPHLVMEEDGPVLLLPGDEDYPQDDPEYALATPVESGPTRIALQLPG